MFSWGFTATKLKNQPTVMFQPTQAFAWVKGILHDWDSAENNKHTLKLSQQTTTMMRQVQVKVFLSQGFKESGERLDCSESVSTTRHRSKKMSSKTTNTTCKTGGVALWDVAHFHLGSYI